MEMASLEGLNANYKKFRNRFFSYIWPNVQMTKTETKVGLLNIKK